MRKKGTTAKNGKPAGERQPKTKCSMCGHEFTTDELLACHAACPMSSGCAMVKCPHCGAEFPRPGPVTRWLERLLRGK
jgi:NAD-dependent SIR2 family protein deacetylase